MRPLARKGKELKSLFSALMNPMYNTQPKSNLLEKAGPRSLSKISKNRIEVFEQVEDR